MGIAVSAGTGKASDLAALLPGNPPAGFFRPALINAASSEAEVLLLGVSQPEESPKPPKN